MTTMMNMKNNKFVIEKNLEVDKKNVIHNPDDDFFIEFLKPYYIVTKDGQYLFGSTQPGRRPDRAFYMVPKNYKLVKNSRESTQKLEKKYMKLQ